MLYLIKSTHQFSFASVCFFFIRVTVDSYLLLLYFASSCLLLCCLLLQCCSFLDTEVDIVCQCAPAKVMNKLLKITINNILSDPCLATLVFKVVHTYQLNLKQFIDLCASGAQILRVGGFQISCFANAS